MAKKLILDPILACLAHICAPQHFFAGLVRHCSYYYLEQFKGKIMNQTLENDKKPNFGLHFGPNLVLIFFLFFFLILLLLDVIHCWKLLLYALSRKTNEPNL